MLWQILNSPMTALLINLAINLIGSIPTIRKAYYQPETESKPAWILFFIGSFFNLFAVDRWVFSMVVYPVAIFIYVVIVTFLVLRINRWVYVDFNMDRKKCPYYAEILEEGDVACKYWLDCLRKQERVIILRED